MNGTHLLISLLLLLAPNMPPPNNGYHAGTSEQQLGEKAASNDPHYLCKGDMLRVNHNGDQVIPPHFPDILSGVSYVIYTCRPTEEMRDLSQGIQDDCLLDNPPPGNDLGFYLDGAADYRGNGLFYNTGKLQQVFNNGKPVELWFAPIVVHDHRKQAFLRMPGGTEIPSHVNVADAFKVVYLNRIKYRPLSANAIVVSGGLPEFDGSDYIVSVEKIDDPSVKAKILTPKLSHGDTLRFSTPVPGNYRVIVTDGKSCGASA